MPPSTQAPSNFTSFGEGSMLGTHSVGTTNIITINPQAVMTDEDGLQQAVAKALVEAQQKGLRIAF